VAVRRSSSHLTHLVRLRLNPALPRSEGSSSVAHPQAWADASQGLGDRQGDSSRNEIGSKASLFLNERVFIDGRRAIVHHAPQLNPSLAPRDEIKGRRERSLHPDGARTAYPATKHAQIGFLDSLHVELRGSGVSVTVVCPYFALSSRDDSQCQEDRWVMPARG